MYDIKKTPVRVIVLLQFKTYFSKNFNMIRLKGCCTLLLLCISMAAYSQQSVGIGVTGPNARLDVVASNPASPTIKDGILIPRINVFPAGVTAAQDGMMYDGVPKCYKWP